MRFTSETFRRMPETKEYNDTLLKTDQNLSPSEMLKVIPIRPNDFEIHTKSKDTRNVLSPYNSTPLSPKEDMNSKGVDT
jgi:transglutaminase/protease-like cytokinesis protein 3